MPLKIRTISPENISRGRIPPGVRENELLCVANGSLANLIRQMSSLSIHAHNIFNDIYNQIQDCDKRIEKIHERNIRLQDKIDQSNYSTSVPLEGGYMKKPYKSNNAYDQHTLERSTLPPAMQILYDRCESPPKLHLLDPYREDSKPAIKYYTNPQYFFDLWRKEMLKTSSVDKIHTRTAATSGRVSPSRRKKSRNSSSTRQQQVPIQSNVVINHYTTKQHERNDDFMNFPSEYQAPQFLRNNAKTIDDNLPPPPGMSLLSSTQNMRSASSSEKNTQNAPLATTELSNNYKGLKISDPKDLLFDDDDDLPPPPPPLSDHTNLIQGLASPSTSSSTSTSNLPTLPAALTLVEANQNSLPPPPPMVSSNAPPAPPPPPPPLLMSTSTIQSNAVPSFVSQNSSEENNKNQTSTRTNLLQEIQMGIKLKKVQKEAEKEEKKRALDNDVTAILQKRMERIMGKDSDDEEEDDDEWE